MADGGKICHNDAYTAKLKESENTKAYKHDGNLITLFRNINAVSPTKKNNDQALIHDDSHSCDIDNINKNNKMKNILCQSRLQNESTVIKIKQDLINWISRLKHSDDNQRINHFLDSKLQKKDKARLQDQSEFVIKRLDIIHKKHQCQKSQRLFTQNFIINVLSEFNIPRVRDTFRCSMSENNFKLYRCEPISLENGCCCSCTSDAMFEVMKGLYDCYKKKNCDNCDCILCGQYMVEIIDQSSNAAGEKIKIEPTIKGKLPADKEKVYKDLAMTGAALPEGNTASEKEILIKVRAGLGLPPPPKTTEDREKEKKAEAAGILFPLEGKTPAEKECILKNQAELGMLLPEGRTPSEKYLIKKIKMGTPYKKTFTGLPTPREGKSPEQKEKILRGMAMAKFPLPEGKTASERKLIKKVRKDLGLPPGPKTATEKDNYNKAQAAGIINPLEKKLPAQKEAILKSQYAAGIPLPEGRTLSEKELIEKVKGKVLRKTHLQKLQKARAAGLLTPLEGKTPEQKENILRGLAIIGLPFPDVKTPSEKKHIEKVRRDVGLPPEPKTPREKELYNKAMAAGIITPLEGKPPALKENILKAQHRFGLPLAEGRTDSEKALIAKVEGISPASPHTGIPADILEMAKTAEVLSPLDGKTPTGKENIIKKRALMGLSLPSAKTPAEKYILDKVRKDVGLRPEPQSVTDKEKYKKRKATGIVTPLEGKTRDQKEKILKSLKALNTPLSNGRTPSEKSLIKKIKGERPLTTPSDKLKKAKAAGFLTPLEGKTPEQKENIVRGLALSGLPLPQPKNASEEKLISKVRNDLGLPPEPKTSGEKNKYNKAMAAGLITPLHGKPSDQKEKILRALNAAGVELPQGRTSSEKLLIASIKGGLSGPTSKRGSEKLRQAEALGLLTPLAGKTPEQKENILRGLALKGLPLPDGATSSEKKLIKKVRYDVGLPPVPKKTEDKKKYDQALAAGVIKPLEGETAEEKEKNLRAQQALGISLAEGRTNSEKELVEKVKQLAHLSLLTGISIPLSKLKEAKAAGLLTPLKGKTLKQKEIILRNIALRGLPLPLGQTNSEKNLIDKVRYDVGLPPEPQSPADKEKYNKGMAIGIITPLEGKSKAQKEKILTTLQAAGIQLPEGRTPSEKALIANITGKVKPQEQTSAKFRKAKVAGLLTPLTGKTPAEKERIIRGLAMQGLPLPEESTPSENKLIEKVRNDLGLPSKPSTTFEKKRYNNALAAGIITPLEGKSPELKEKILRAQYLFGIPLLEGRTASEKALVNRIKLSSSKPLQSDITIPINKLKSAKAAGLLSPFEGKTPAEKEKIFLASHGLPLPSGKTPSERYLVNKVRYDIGLPPEPQTAADKKKYDKAMAVGIIAPLAGKPSDVKEKILRDLVAAGIPLPEGRSPSEIAMITKIRSPAAEHPSEKLRKAKVAGFLTPLAGKPREKKEKILRGLAMQGLPLPEGTTFSDKELIDKVRKDVGLPPIPTTALEKKRYNNALAAGLIVPLEGKPPKLKEKLLKAQKAMGIPLPEGRTRSEKALIAKIKGAPPLSFSIIASEPKAPTEPQRDKVPSKKDRMLRTPQEAGIPLPDGQTPGTPKAGPLAVLSEKFKKAKAAGLLTPLRGKSPSEKNKIVKGLAELSLPIPEGTTPSEKSFLRKAKTDLGIPPEATTPSEKDIIKTAKQKGFLTPLTGKSPEQKEKIIRGLAEAGLPMPEGRTQSEKRLIKRIRQDFSLPPESTASEKMGKIRKKAKKVGPLAPKTSTRVLPTTGITEELEEIANTKCDRSCGCEKKKIKFKHSYLKIKVTSPDISTTCPCPDDCFPYPKPEVMTDNEGIKVTVGSAVGIPAFAKTSHTEKSSSENSDLKGNYHENQNEKGTVTEPSVSLHEPLIHKTLNYLLKNDNYMTDSSNDEFINSSQCFYKVSKIGEDVTNPLCDLHVAYDRRELNEDNNISYLCDTCSSRSVSTKTPSRSSFKSVIIIKTNNSDGLLAASNLDIATVSIISIIGSSYTSNISSDLSSGHDIVSEGSELSTTQFSYGNTDSSSSYHVSRRYTRDYFTSRLKILATKNAPICNRYALYRISQTELPKNDIPEKYVSVCHNKASKFVTRDFHINYATMDVSSTTPLTKSLSEGSSIFLVLSTSDEFNSDQSLNDTDNDNPICVHMSQVSRIRRASKKDVSLPSSSKDGKKERKEKKLELSKSNSISGKDSESSSQTSIEFERYAPTEYRMERSVKWERAKIYRAVSIDTMQDRPCCCTPKKVDVGNSLCSALLSDIFIPIEADHGINKEDEESFQMISKSVSSTREPYLISRNQSAIRLSVCHIPPCKRPPLPLTGKHAGASFCPKGTSDPFSLFDGVCHPEQANLVDMFERMGKKIQPTDCKEGASCCPQPKKLNELKLKIPNGQNQTETVNKQWKPGDPGEQTCESCGRPVDGKVKCLCHGEDKMKKIRNLLCPCTSYTAPPIPEKPPDEVEDGATLGKKKVCKCCICQGGKAKKGVKCSCAQNTCNPGEDKPRCDCFIEPEPETPIDYELLRIMIEEQKKVEMENSLKLLSENTQTQSGFKIKFRKKPVTEMTVEEAIKYFELHPEEVPEPIPEPPEDCVCDEEPPKPKMKPKPAWRVRLSLLNKRLNCECPEDPPDPEPDEFYPIPLREAKPLDGPGGQGGQIVQGGQGALGGLGGQGALGGLGGQGALGGLGGPGGQGGWGGQGGRGQIAGTDELNPKGFKVVVGGKGSGSEGLKVLRKLKEACCFDLLIDQTFPNTSKSPPDSPK